MRNLLQFIKKSFHRVLSILVKDDQEFRNLVFWFRTKRKINISNPITFTDKINWMMSHLDYRQYAPLADKYEVRKYIKAKGYERYLNQVYGVYSIESEIDFEKLPSSFVLKPTHGSSMVLICRDKSKMDLDKVRKTCKHWLKTNYSKLEHEMNYADIPHRIVCEKLLQDESGKVPLDFKIFCFHGQPKYIAVDFDRFGNHTRGIYDTNWNLTRFAWGAPFDPKPLAIPARLEDMISFAKDISNEHDFVRVDLYQVDEKIIFGELTFTPSAGTPRNSYDCDLAFGSCLDLSKVQLDRKQ